MSDWSELIAAFQPLQRPPNSKTAKEIAEEASKKSGQKVTEGAAFNRLERMRLNGEMESAIVVVGGRRQRFYWPPKKADAQKTKTKRPAWI